MTTRGRVANLLSQLKEAQAERQRIIDAAADWRDRCRRGLVSEFSLDQERLESCAQTLQARCERLSRRVQALVDQATQEDVLIGVERRHIAVEVDLMQELVEEWRDYPLYHGYRRERQGTAFHEASHAVVACLLGLEFSEVTIQPNGIWAGHILGFFSLCPVDDQIMMTWAGVLAEQRHFGLSDQDGPVDGSTDPEDLSDYADITTLAEEATHSQGRERDTYIYKLRCRTDKLLDRPEIWAQVEAVAEELLMKWTLSEEQVRAVMGRYGREVGDARREKD
jgi:hypothetical protein